MPANFFDPALSFEVLGCEASFKELPQYRAWFVWDASLRSAPALLEVLEHLQDTSQYNKILCSWKGGVLSLAIGQGRQLLLANEYPAEDFTTAQYYIFLALKTLQLNPEVSQIRFIHSIGPQDELSLLRYFKSVQCA